MMFPFPFVPVSAAVELTTITFRSSATSTTDTITGPADIAAGDLLVLLDRALNGSGIPTEVVPTDFNIINSMNNGVTRRQILSYKIADGSEASASLTGMNGTSSDLKILAVFQGDTAISSVTVQDVNGEITDGDPAAQVKNASGGAVPLIVIGGYGSSLTINPRTWTGGTPSELSNGTIQYLLYEIFNSSPADITVNMDDEGAGNGLQSCYLECA